MALAPGQRTNALKWGLVALAALLLSANTPYFERLMNANERPRLLQGMALVDGGEWAIDGYATHGIKPGINIARGADGRVYPNKPPGASLVAAFAWVLVGDDLPDLRLYTITARLLGGLLPVLVLFAFILARAGRRRESTDEEPAEPDRTPSWAMLAAVVLLALGSPLASQAHLLFGHALAACLLFVGVAILVDDSALGKPWTMAVGGALAGSAVAVEYTAAFVGIVIAVHLATRVRREPRSVFAAVAGALVPVCGLALYHDAVFGSPWSTGYHHSVREEFAEIHAEGLLGLHLPTGHTLFEHLLSPWGGLLFWMPLACFAVAGLVFCAREGGRHRRRASVFLACFLVLLLVNLGLEQGGGWRVGPRYLVIGMPFLLAGLAGSLKFVGRSALASAAFVALGTWSVAINAMAANLFPHLIPVGNPLGDMLMPLFLDGRAPWGLLHPWIVVFGCLICFWLPMFFVLRPRNAGWRGLALGVIAGLMLVAAGTSLPAAPDAEVNLDAIESIWEPPGP